MFLYEHSVQAVMKSKNFELLIFLAVNRSYQNYSEECNRHYRNVKRKIKGCIVVYCVK